MVCYVSGSNIFGQWSWISEDVVFNEFRAITAIEHQKCSSSLPKVLQLNWSYNLLQVDDKLYISGAWSGKESQLVELPIPIEDSNSNEEIIVVGNDYRLLILIKATNTLQVLDLKQKNEVKRINLEIEEPIVNREKRQKKDCKISKVVLVNDSCLYLNCLGDVYNGILPSYVDTGHCRGAVCDIQCGYEHYVLLTSTGSVYTWGNGRRLQLGHGDVSNMDTPTEVEALSGIKIIKIRTGGWHSLALSDTGDLYAWGWNNTGQLGIKHDTDTESHALPTPIDLFKENGEEVTLNVKDIACGSTHSAILLEDNTVWVAGSNKYGQLGCSEIKYPVINNFKTMFSCDKSCEFRLMCGPWTTVIVSK